VNTLTKQILVLAFALALVLFGSAVASRADALGFGNYYTGESCVKGSPGLLCGFEIAGYEAAVDGGGPRSELSEGKAAGPSEAGDSRGVP
jgi:hypothetical protein